MPVAVFVREGYAINYTPTADVAAGDVVDLGNMVGIATRAIPANELGAIQITGVYDVTKKTGEAHARFDRIYWDEGTLSASNTGAYGEATMGIAEVAAASGDATTRVVLIPSFA